MAEFNESAKEITAKIVYVGPGLSGKTTNLKMVHRLLHPSDRGQLLQVDTAGERTLFFDMLPITGMPPVVGYTLRFQLLTVPGQIYYAAARRMVMRNADALVFVADSASSRLDATIAAMADMHRLMRTLDLDPATLPIVLQFNKRDLPGAVSVDLLAEAINVGGWPMYAAVASEGRGVLAPLADAMQQVDRRLRAAIG